MIVFFWLTSLKHSSKVQPPVIQYKPLLVRPTFHNPINNTFPQNASYYRTNGLEMWYYVNAKHALCNLMIHVRETKVQLCFFLEKNNIMPREISIL